MVKNRRTLKEAIIQAFVKNWIVKTMKGNAAMLSGYKTYIIAALTLVLAGLHLVGIDVPGVPPIDLGTAILMALGLFSARAGARSDAAKAAFVASPGIVSVDSAKAQIKNTDASSGV